MTLLQIVVLLVALQRLAELLYASRNTRRLLRAGGYEVGARHYPLFVALHGTWLLALLVLAPNADEPNRWLLAAFGLLQLARLWVVVTLGRFWTTRLIIVADAPLVRRGPYRFLRHPNYTVVIGEIAILPLAFGAWHLALIFSFLNLALLAWRIRLEDTALAERRRISRAKEAGHRFVTPGTDANSHTAVK